jgi:hypothetical protein
LQWTFISGFTSAITVGGKNRPSRLPPQSTFAPPFAASSTQAWVRSTAFLVDHRPQIRLLIERVAQDERLRPLEELLGEGVGDLLVEVDALDRDADLARVGERAVDGALDGEVEIGVVVDDDGRVAAELEDDALPAGLPLELPADRGAAGEGHELEPVVGDQLVGEVGAARRHVDHAGRACRPRRGPRPASGRTPAWRSPA